MTGRIEAARLRGELRALARGRGLLAVDLDARVGPALRAVAGLDGLSGGALRAALSAWLRERLAALPEDLRTVAGVALGLDPHVDHRLLTDRIEWLAGELHRDPRTVRRRGDEAFRLLAEVASDGAGLAPGPPGDTVAAGGATVEVAALGASVTVDGPAGTPLLDEADADGSGPRALAAAAAGWYVERVSAVLRLDGLAPELLELRRIVAVEDGLSTVVLFMSLPRPVGAALSPRDLGVEVVYGARALRVERFGDTLFSLELRLPHSLAAGQRHEFVCLWRVPAGQEIAPRYALSPTSRCDELDLRVRFPEGADVRVQRVDGLPLRTVEDTGFALPRVALDGVDEACAHFRQLALGRCYGLRWG
jgi:hypothetical protein